MSAPTFEMAEPGSTELRRCDVCGLELRVRYSAEGVSLARVKCRQMPKGTCFGGMVTVPGEHPLDELCMWEWRKPDRASVLVWQTVDPMMARYAEAGGLVLQIRGTEPTTTDDNESETT